MNLVRNVLVRDKIPELVAQHNIKPIITIAVGSELTLAMHKNLQSEVRTLQSESKREDVINKLADISEMLAAFRQHLGISDTELSRAMGTRRRELGSFTKGYFIFSENGDPLFEIAASLAK